MNILISACLLGTRCRYDGTGELADGIKELMKQHNLIPVCPEQLGGLATPRTPAERKGCLVITRDGQDVTNAYQKGAQEVLKLAKLLNCSLAILKQRSPSCGSREIYDGTFQHQKIPGIGTTTQLLHTNGIMVLSEEEIKTLVSYSPPGTKC